jgi:hypothetical protein
VDDYTVTDMHLQRGKARIRQARESAIFTAVLMMTFIDEAASDVKILNLLDFGRVP